MADTADGLVITGPTASGKTALAIAVAQQLDGEIISLDSRQVYQGLDIGTAKPTPQQLATVPHFGIDVLPPDQRYSAGRFAADARAWISEIRARGHVPILAGGTGFFLRALTHPMFEEPQLDPVRKESLRTYLERFSREELLQWLRSLDEVTAARLETEGGHQRLGRAIEVALLTGRSLSEWHRKAPPADPPLRFVTFVMNLPRAELYERINSRVDQMLEAGLLDEVRALLQAGYDESAPGMNTTGYIELLPQLRGEISLEQAADDIRRATRRYARRQLTWFRHQLPADAVWLDATKGLEVLTEEVTSVWSNLRKSAESA